jgi:hypothetical protein
MPAGPFNGESFLADLKAGGSALDKYKTPRITLDELKTAHNALAGSPAAPKAAGFQLGFAVCTDSTGDTQTGACLSVTTYALEAIHSYPQSAEAETYGMDVARYDIAYVFTSQDAVVSQQRLSFLTQGIQQMIDANY